MISKMVILAVCGLAIVSMVNATAVPKKTCIEPTPCDKAQTTGDLSGCSTSTLSSCTSALDNVSGSGCGTASGLSLSLSLVIGPLLCGLIDALGPLLCTVLELVQKLLGIILALLCKVISLVIDLLNGLICKDDYDDGCNKACTKACDDVKSCGGSDGVDAGTIKISLDLIDSIKSLVICIKL